MKNLIILFFAIVLTSCSNSDDPSPSNNNNPWNPSGFIRFQDVAATRWYYNKEEFILEDGSLLEFPPSECKKASWFYIGTNALTPINSYMDDGSGICIDDGTNAHYSIYDVGEGFFNITFKNSIGDYIENQYELFKIFDNNYTHYGSDSDENVLIWVDDNVDEIHDGQQIATKKLYFTRWEN